MESRVKSPALPVPVSAHSFFGDSVLRDGMRVDNSRRPTDGFKPPLRCGASLATSVLHSV